MTDLTRADASERNPLLRKLGNIADLPEADRRAIRDVSAETREIPAHRDIIEDGERPDHVHLMLSGWSARYKMVPEGTRQLTAFLIPGDFCDLHVTILDKMDHGSSPSPRRRSPSSRTIGWRR